jgi:hypothetical protein
MRQQLPADKLRVGDDGAHAMLDALDASWAPDGAMRRR